MFVLWYGSRVHHRELHAAPARLERNDNSPPPCADLAAARRALQRHLPRRTVHITQPGLPSDGVRRARGRAMVPQHDARLALRAPRGAHATVCRALPAAVGRAVRAYARTDIFRESHRAYRSPQGSKDARGAGDAMPPITAQLQVRSLYADMFLFFAGRSTIWSTSTTNRRYRSCRPSWWFHGYRPISSTKCFQSELLCELK